MLKAKCNKCGFEKEFYYGGGMRDFMTVCNVPAIDNKTGKFVIKNFFKKDKLKDIVFYNEHTMYHGRINKNNNINNSHEWGEILLKKSNNLCPTCRLYSMDFEFCGCFD